MTAPKTFGQRLRELRRAKGLSLRVLADLVGVDFTYLSKLENDRIPPPSAKTIASLAEHLEGDADELSVLAEKIPADLVDVFRSNPTAIKLFRSIAGDIKEPGDWQRVLNQREARRSDES
ncbi:MAG: helix-turn-helix transcriptional regulator [Chloroflexota bacterium]